MSRKCKNCGKPLTHQKSFCSFKCNAEHRKRTTSPYKGKCKVCGKPKPKTNKEYCSVECRSKHRKNKKVNLNNDYNEKSIKKARERLGMSTNRGKTYAEIRKEAQKRGKSKYEVEHKTNQVYY